MSFNTLIDIVRRYSEFRLRWREYATVIKGLAQEFFRDKFLKLYIFGSTVRGDYRPLSDIDVAIVLREYVDEWMRARFRCLVNKRLGMVNPFEIHIVTEDEWMRWYRRFIKEDYVVLDP